jgi:fibronectin type 3 domain-containing protein
MDGFSTDGPTDDIRPHEIGTQSESPEIPSELLTTFGWSFTENRGQVENADVLFYATNDPVSVGLMRDGVIFTYREETSDDEGPIVDDGDRRMVSFEMRLEGCNPVEPFGIGPMGYPSNFYFGKDPDRWVEGARSFKEVLYENVYDAIDLRFYFKDGVFKYDFVIRALGDFDDIVICYDRVLDLSIEPTSGDLLIATDLGTLREMAPIAYLYGLEEELIDIQYKIEGDNRCGFTVDISSLRHRPFVIDPGLEVGTYFGGSGDDELGVAAVLENGTILIGGNTNSVDFPGFAGTYVPKGGFDSVLALLDVNLSRVLGVFAIGGSDDEFIGSCRMISSYDCLLMVTTLSDDIPTTNDATKAMIDGASDGVMVRINTRSMQRVYCTYFGGRDEDSCYTLEVLPDGDIIILMSTNSDDLPTTSGAFCTTYQRTYTDVKYTDSAYIVRYDNHLRNISWMSYVNGMDNVYLSVHDFPWIDIDIHPDGFLYLVENTRRADLPVTNGAVFETKNNDTDVYILKLNVTDGSWIGGSYFGGDYNDIAQLVVVDSDLGVWVSGITNSLDINITPTAVQNHSKGNGDAFFTLFNFDLTAVKYSTYLGGLRPEGGPTLYLGPEKGMFTTIIQVGDDSLRTSEGCFDPTFNGAYDGYICTIDIRNTTPIYASYIGGSGRDYIWVDEYKLYRNGTIIMGFFSESTECYTTADALKSENYGGDGYFIMFDPSPCDVPFAPVDLDSFPGDGILDLFWSPPPFNGALITGYEVFWRSEDNSTIESTIVYGSAYVNDTLVNGRNYTYWVRARNSMGWGPNSTELTVRPLGFPEAPDFHVKTGDGNVTLNWSRPAYLGGGALMGYQIEKGLSLSSMSPLVPGLIDGNQTSIVDPDVTPGEKYYYRIRALNERNNGSWARWEIVPGRPPSSPKDFTAEPIDGAIKLTWKDPLDDGGAQLQEYRIYLGTIPDDYSLLQALPATTQLYTIFSLENGQDYWIYIVAKNKWGEGTRSPVFMESPFTKPSMPMNLTATSGDRTVTLTWDPPVTDGGREIVGYHVFMKGPDDLTFVRIAQNVSLMQFIVPSLVNGEEYSFEISAINEAGEGLHSGTVEGTPMTTPSEPWGLTLDSVPKGVEILWSSPNSTGGSVIQRYWLFRGISRTDMVPIDVSNREYYVDEGAKAGTTYFYGIMAENAMGNGTLSALSEYRRLLIPGAPINIELTAGRGSVKLDWAPPTDDGGSSINSYDIYRGTSIGDISVYRQAETSTSFTDSDVANGRTYFYYIIARNDVGPGPRSSTVNGTPLDVPDRVLNLIVTAKDDHVVITWDPPIQEGSRAPVTGYIILKGTSLDHMLELVKLDLETTSYTDLAVDPEVTYYYQVVVDSELGAGPPTSWVDVEIEGPDEVSTQVYPYLLLLIVIVVLGVVLIVRRRGAVDEDGEDVPSLYADDYASRATETSTVVDVPMVTAPISTEPESPGIAQYIIEEVLVVYRDGRLITSSAREECGTEDADLMSGMLIAVQGLIQDGLEGGGTLESIKYGDNLISLATGNHLVVAAVVYGKAGEELGSVLRETATRIENAYSGIIEDWTGDPSALAGLDEIISPLIERTSYITREDVGEATTEKAVSMLSAVDFHRGYVRLKLAAVNTTEDTIIDSAVEVHYDTDMLHLETVEPESMVLRGDRVSLGNIKPGERKAVAIMFDPQICQGSHLDGHLSYYDSKGELRYVEMKRRHADVVCPIFFTAKNANKAMLRRLIKEKLHATDLRVYRYPRNLPAYEVLLIAKGALGDDVQLVREYITRGPPYEAEVWYYAETKVKGYQFVIRLGVMEEKGVLEIFAASTAMEPITGLLAEFRRELNVAYAEGRTGDQRIEVERDEQVRKDLATRPLRLDMPEDDEVVVEDIAEA